MDPDSPASPVAPPVRQINLSLRSVPPPVPPPALETAPVAEVTIDCRLTLVDLVESRPGLRLVLADLPPDSSPALVSVFGRLAVEVSKSGAFEAALATPRAVMRR